MNTGSSQAESIPGTDRSEQSAGGITARGLTRRFDGRAVLDQVDFSVAPGEFVVLLGKSGTGKSTLLRLIAGLDTPSDGALTVDGEIAMAFQDARLLPWRKVWRNVVFGLDAKPREGKQRSLEVLDEVGLSAKADAWPLTLSGGEAQRASLARALVRDPQVLLLDEPFGALDALTRITMQELVIRLWETHQPAVVMVTHDVAEAVHLADRILVLDDGKFVVDVQVPQARPRSRTDADLIELQRQLMTTLGVGEH